jgi:two-component system sensor histidine kinase/response regulator
MFTCLSSIPAVALAAQSGVPALEAYLQTERQHPSQSQQPASTIDPSGGLSSRHCKPVDPAELFAELARWIPGDAAAAGSAPGVRAGGVAEGVIDVDLALRYWGDRPAFLNGLRGFLDRRDDEVRRIAAALAEGRPRDAERIAHSFKSVVAAFGGGEVRAAAADVEAMLRDDAPNASVGVALARLEAAMAAFVSRAKALCAEALPPGPAQDRVDADVLAGELSALRAMLEADDAQARTAWRAVRASLETRAEPEAVARLARQVDAFEFPAAAATLAELVAALTRAGTVPGAGYPATTKR